ncbi:hypothetical protein PCE1_002904 [Barthelona sp. PCE]
MSNIFPFLFMSVGIKHPVPFPMVAVASFDLDVGPTIIHKWPALKLGADEKRINELMASIALPDGAHAHESLTVHFRIPQSFGYFDFYGLGVYGCLRNPKYKRGARQAAFIVLSSFPLYSMLEPIVESALFFYLETQQLTICSILYQQINRAFCSNSLTVNILQHSFNLNVPITYRYRQCCTSLLVLQPCIKYLPYLAGALLRGDRFLIYSSNPTLASMVAIAISYLTYPFRVTQEVLPLVTLEFPFENHSAYVAGTSSIVLLREKHLFDVLIDCDTWTVECGVEARVKAGFWRQIGSLLNNSSSNESLIRELHRGNRGIALDEETTWIDEVDVVREYVSVYGLHENLLKASVLLERIDFLNRFVSVRDDIQKSEAFSQLASFVPDRSHHLSTVDDDDDERDAEQTVAVTETRRNHLDSIVSCICYQTFITTMESDRFQQLNLSPVYLLNRGRMLLDVKRAVQQGVRLDPTRIFDYVLFSMQEVFSDLINGHVDTTGLKSCMDVVVACIGQRTTAEMAMDILETTHPFFFLFQNNPLYRHINANVGSGTYPIDCICGDISNELVMYLAQMLEYMDFKDWFVQCYLAESNQKEAFVSCILDSDNMFDSITCITKLLSDLRSYIPTQEQFQKIVKILFSGDFSIFQNVLVLIDQWGLVYSFDFAPVFSQISSTLEKKKYISRKKQFLKGSFIDLVFAVFTHSFDEFVYSMFDNLDLSNTSLSVSLLTLSRFLSSSFARLSFYRLDRELNFVNRLSMLCKIFDLSNAAPSLILAVFEFYSVLLSHSTAVAYSGLWDMRPIIRHIRMIEKMDLSFISPGSLQQLNENADIVYFFYDQHNNNVDSSDFESDLEETLANTHLNPLTPAK